MFIQTFIRRILGKVLVAGYCIQDISISVRCYYVLYLLSSQSARGDERRVLTVHHITNYVLPFECELRN